MKSIRFNIMLAALAAASVPVLAQSSTAPETDADDDVIFETRSLELVRVSPELRDIIMQDRRKEPQSYAAPKFAIRTPDNKFILSIGGQVNPILGYDLGNDLYDADGGGIDFTTGAIPVPAVPGKKSAFFINPLRAYIDFTIVGFGGTDNRLRPTSSSQ